MAARSCSAIPILISIPFLLSGGSGFGCPHNGQRLPWVLPSFIVVYINASDDWRLLRGVGSIFFGLTMCQFWMLLQGLVEYLDPVRAELPPGEVVDFQNGAQE